MPINISLLQGLSIQTLKRQDGLVLYIGRKINLPILSSLFLNENIIRKFTN